MVCKYAMENDLIQKDYSRFVEHNAHRLDDIDTVLIMIYTGLRSGEFVEVENKNIYLEERYFRGGF